MRVGKNPNKNEGYHISDKVHQVIIPVYIPDQEGYFKDAIKILKLCLDSLIQTTHASTCITLVNNGSDDITRDLLNTYLEKGDIQELIHTDNIGKINAAMKAMKGHYFELITIADADTLFLNGWQRETVRVFNAFPKAGVVGLVPQIKLFHDLCHNVLYDGLWSNNIRFTEVPDPDAMRMYYKSIEWKDNYNKDYLKVHMTVSDATGYRAVIGSGHFVATYRRDALRRQPDYQVTEKLGTKSDREFLDMPVLKVGGWRLTTENNFAYHMGNVHEIWMDDCLRKLNEEGEKEFEFKPKKSLESSYLLYFLKNHLFRKLMEKKWIMRWYMLKKGLPKSMAKTY